MNHEFLHILTDKEAATLLPDYFNGSISDENKELVDKWRNLSEENNQKFNALLDVVMDFRALDAVSRIDMESALRTVNRRISRKRRAWVHYIERVAAILAIPLLVATIWSVTRSVGGEPVYHQLKVETGMTGRVVLPDSTVVILNSGSTLRYPAVFASDSRKVELLGEGYFDVRKDSERKFSVKLGDGSSVNVYGTRFNVDAYPGDESVITLVEGSIGFGYSNKKGDSNEVRLAPDQQITKNVNGDVSIINTEGANAIAWKDNKIILDSTPLKHILKTLERRFNVKFRVKNPEIEKYTFSGGDISIKSMDYVLETLNISTGMKWRYVSSPDEDDVVIEIS